MSAQSSTLDRRAVVADLLADRPRDLLVVTGLGSPTYDVAAAGDDPRNFYLWGAMGSAVTVGLGLALARQQQRVLVVTGDGELLMAMGALATVGAAAPVNLAVVVLDNASYGETGGQDSHTAFGVDLPEVALACGFAHAETVTEAAGVGPLRARLLAQPGPLLAAVKVGRQEQPRVLPTRDGQELRLRFRRAVLSGVD